MDKENKREETMTLEEKRVIRRQVEYESAINLLFHAKDIVYDARCLMTSSKEFEEIKNKIMKIEFGIYDLERELMKDYNERYQSDRYELDDENDTD